MRRVLSIDGGGIKGVFRCAFLAELEKTLDHKVGGYFDLIAGTSTGGSIALGLGLGLSAAEILDFYETHGPRIFPQSKGWRRLKHRWPLKYAFSKYSNEPLIAAFQSVFGDRKLGEAKTRLVIPAVNLETGEPHVFKTPHAPRFQTDRHVRVADVALATGAAPTFFPTHRLNGTTPLVDGGLFANNPTLDAAIEAVHVLGWAKEEVEILSLGCSYKPLDIKTARDKPMGQAYWADKAIEVMFAVQSRTSLGKSSVSLPSDGCF